jgi:inner membrane protein
MDPICHTMFGAALACTGLEKQTRFGRATLIIGANLPDVDVLSYAWGATAALEFRRGLTHGVPALIVLSLTLAAGMFWLARVARRASGAPVANFGWLLALAAISVVSHPTLDFLNVYGVRWLMPFDGTWFYGDVLYIADPWLWAILALALIAVRVRRDHVAKSLWARPACAGLGVALVYVVAMMGGESIARGVVEASLGEAPHPRLMVAPIPVDPFRRTVVIDDEFAYRIGVVNLLPRPRFELNPQSIPKGDGDAARRAAATEDGRVFMGWARFPFFEVDGPEGDLTVYVIDARYALDREDTFASIQIPLPALDSGPI